MHSVYVAIIIMMEDGSNKVGPADCERIRSVPAYMYAITTVLTRNEIVIDRGYRLTRSTFSVSLIILTSTAAY
jgi:hypothetical protein